MQATRTSAAYEDSVNTLIYKRTHKGDPDTSGTFGIHDCMGSVRGNRFDSVIGVGGKNPDPGFKDIARKINWIGMGPTRKTEVPRGFRGPYVTFECFVLLDETGPDLKELAPKLFRHMFEDQNVRLVMSRSLPIEMQEEVENILRWAENNQSRTLRVFEKPTSTKRRSCRC